LYFYGLRSQPGAAAADTGGIDCGNLRSENFLSGSTRGIFAKEVVLEKSE
jgi:hypothetical protein